MSKSDTKTKTQTDRDENFWRVLNAALELDFKKGHLKWTMSELSRKSGITRSLIYYHFGRSKMAILDEAIRVIGEELVGIGDDRIDIWRKGDWEASIKRTRAVSTQSPYLANFYLLHRERPTDAGEAIRKIETSYLKKLEMFFPHLGPAGQKALFSLFFGITFSPFCDDEVIRLTVRAVKSLTGSAEPKIPSRAGN